jgi:hypothetical protein
MNTTLRILFCIVVSSLAFTACTNKYAFKPVNADGSSNKLVVGGDEDDPTPLPALEDPPACVFESENQEAACPIGQVGKITKERQRENCNGELSDWSSWTLKSNTCHIPACVTESETQMGTCPSGQVGQISETRTRENCEGEVSSWSQWTASSNTCHNPVCSSDSEMQTVSCAPGKIGSITQQRSRQVCEGSGGPWGEWMNVSNTCRDPICNSDSEMQTVACPSGKIGSITQQRNRQTCEGIPGTWSDWSNVTDSCRDPVCNQEAEMQKMECPQGQVGEISQERKRQVCEGVPLEWQAWTVVGNTCRTPVCVNESESQMQSCPQGKVGQINETRTRKNCDGVPEAWSAWTVSSNTCRDPVCTNDAELKTVQCAPGKVGQITEQRTRQICEGSPGAWGNWAVIQNSCRDPICTTDTETQSLACQPGYKGSISQMRTRQVCEGTPAAWSAWVTTNNSCELIEVPADESFTQKATGGKIDILMVVDNSESMERDQQKMATKFQSFIANLSDLDYQIGVTTTDAGPEYKPGYTGILDYFDGKSMKFITPKTPNKEVLFKQTVQRKETLNCYKTGSHCGSNTEEPMYASILAMHWHNSYNAGFFRDGADLAIVVISDEDEKSNLSFNPHKPQEVLDEAKLIWGEKKVVKGYGIIVQPGDKKCLHDQAWERFLGAGAYYGTYVAELARLTGGETGSICQKDYSDSLKAITKNMRQNLLYKEVVLAHTPVVGSVQVSFSPSQPITVSVVGNKVIFSKPPTEGTVIKVSYKYKN